jgi:type 1 fimbria pilin
MIRSTTLLLLVLLPLGPPVCAADALKGRVQMAGSIVDSACSIRVGSDRQTVAFKPMALNGLLNGDPSSQQFLTVYVTDCIASEKSNDTDTSQRFRLTFEGQAYGKYFAIEGVAKGIALQIKDHQGKLVSPGMLLEHSPISADQLLLNYSLTLVGSGRVLEAGDYHATLKLNIQHF